MANHAEELIALPFINVIHSVAITDSVLMHIPCRKCKEWWCAADACWRNAGGPHLYPDVMANYVGSHLGSHIMDKTKAYV